MKNYGYHGKGKIIHNYVQLECYNNGMNGKPRNASSGEKTILTHEGCILSIQISQGLPYLPINTYYLDGWNTLTHVVLNSDMYWDNSVRDSTE